MNKWYENENLDEDIILSSRVRLARNIKKYPFSNIISNEQSQMLLKDINEIFSENNFDENYNFIEINNLSDIDKYCMLENHTISPELLKKSKPSAALINGDDSVSVLVNEEDHLRIQTILPGNNIETALEKSNKIDDIIEEKTEYAFDKKYGYLTSCITNTGTGLRASFMIHIPMLEFSGQLRNIIPIIGKFGMTIRGIYGEGSEPIGSIYQISNQITLGKSETEIIEGLKSITEQIIQNENIIRENIIKSQKYSILDKVYRSYGILSNCKKISSKEAMSLLSDVRFGIMSGILDIKKPKLNIFNIMMNIQPGNLQKNAKEVQTNIDMDCLRAKYINDMFNV